WDSDAKTDAGRSLGPYRYHVGPDSRCRGCDRDLLLRLVEHGSGLALISRPLDCRIHRKKPSLFPIHPGPMSGEMIFVLCVIAFAGALSVPGKVRLDIVALLVVLALVLGGTLSPSEALAGFGEPVVITVAGLLVISDMLTRTGVAQHIGNRLARHGRHGETRLLILLTLVAAALGCFMSNTAVVAIFIPVVLSVANSTNMNAPRLLLPLAYAAMVSGMLTLIATTSNLVVSAELVRAGFAPFGFFSFSPIGLTVLIAFIIYIVTVGRRLMPGARVAPPKTPTRGVRDLLDEFELPGSAHRL